MKFAKSLVIAAVLTTAAVSGAATAMPPGIMYHLTFYSDATHTEQVGWYIDRCWNGNVVASPVHGTTSPYYTLEAVGECPGGYW